MPGLAVAENLVPRPTPGVARAPRADPGRGPCRAVPARQRDRPGGSGGLAQRRPGSRWSRSPRRSRGSRASSSSTSPPRRWPRRTPSVCSTILRRLAARGGGDRLHLPPPRRGRARGRPRYRAARRAHGGEPRDRRRGPPPRRRADAGRGAEPRCRVQPRAALARARRPARARARPRAAWSRTSPSTCTRARSWASPGSSAPGRTELVRADLRRRPARCRPRRARRPSRRPSDASGDAADGRGLPRPRTASARASSSACRCGRT